MITQTIINTHQAQQGWTDSTVLDLLTEFVETLGASEALAAFLAEKAAPIDSDEFL